MLRLLPPLSKATTARLMQLGNRRLITQIHQAQIAAQVSTPRPQGTIQSVPKPPSIKSPTRSLSSEAIIDPMAAMPLLSLSQPSVIGTLKKVFWQKLRNSISHPEVKPEEIEVKQDHRNASDECSSPEEMREVMAFVSSKAKLSESEKVSISEKVIVENVTAEYKSKEGLHRFNSKIFIPKDNNDTPRPTIFYFIGNAFMAKEVWYTHRICIEMALKTGAQVVTIAARQAPENCHPIPVNDSYEIYKYFITYAKSKGIDRKNIYFIGYSSGGYNATFAALRAIHEGLPLHGQGLASPFINWDRFSTGNKYGAIQDQDTRVSEDLIRRAFEAYLPIDADLSDPNVTPLYYPKEILGRLPPTYIICGSEDRTYGDAVDWHGRIGDSGVSSNLEILPKKNHGYPWDEPHIMGELACKTIRAARENQHYIHQVSTFKYQQIQSAKKDEDRPTEKANMGFRR